MLKSEELINKVKSYNKFLNPDTLSKAYDFALKAHKTQKHRKHSSERRASRRHNLLILSRLYIFQFL